MATDQSDLRRMVEANLRMIESELERNTLPRARQYPSVVFDVQYEQLVADPVGTVRRIYHHFGLEWSSGLRSSTEGLYARKSARQARTA